MYELKIKCEQDCVLPKSAVGMYGKNCSLQDRSRIVIFITADHIALSCGDSTALRTWRA